MQGLVKEWMELDSNEQSDQQSKANETDVPTFTARMEHILLFE